MLSKFRERARLAALGVLLVACNADQLVAPAPVQESAFPVVLAPALVSGAATGRVVISQVYGAGGNGGATLQNDYVELFNAGDQAVSIGGWKLHYASTIGTSWTNTLVIPAGKSVAPGGYFLIQLATGGTAGVALPSPDASGSIQMATAAGKVVLTSANVTLPAGVACPTDPSMVDRIAYGSATGDASCGAVWGRTTNTSLTNAIFRKDDGCAVTGTITDLIAQDFEAKAAAPRNSASSPRTCTVAPPPVVVVGSVTITNAPSTIAPGAETQLTAKVLDTGGNEITSPTLAWSSSNTGVATVTATGLLKGVATGSATLTATSGGKSATAEVTVYAPPAVPPPAIVISQVYGGGGNSGATLKNDFIELFNPGTQPVDVTGWSVQVWSSSASAWATTPITGIILPGQYYLVQQGAGAGGTAELPAPDAVGTITMSSTASRVILVHSTAAATGPCPAGAIDQVAYGTSTCSAAQPEGWGIPDAAVLTNTTALLRKSAGCTYNNTPNTDFTAGVPAPRNSATAATYCVPAGPLDKVTMTGTATSVRVGGIVQFGAVARDANDIPRSATITWSASTPDVTVDNSGKVTGVSVNAAGVTITATAVSNGITRTATRTLTVAPAAQIVSVALTPSTWTMETGATKAFAATATDDAGGTLTPVVTWSSSNEAVATISASGVLTAVAPGTATVTATASNGVAGTAAVTITLKPGSLSLQPRTDLLPTGFQAQLFLGSNGVDAYGNPITRFNVAWSSSNPAIVNVNAATGVITATGSGLATITATANSDGVTKASTNVNAGAVAIAPNARRGHDVDLGVPADADPSDDVILTRQQYVTSFNPRRNVPNWVSWNLDASHKGSVARCNCFTADTGLVARGLPAYDTNDWINSGSNGQYSRGHMSPSADWNVSAGDNAATFFLTNMLPQNQPMNGGPWGTFEDYLRTRAVGSTQVYIVSGGIFTKNRSFMQTVNGQPTSRTYAEGFGTISDRGQIAIPDSIWKIAVIVPDTRNVGQVGSPSEVEVIAINTPNEAPAAGATWQTYQTTIANIEASTGYDFLSKIAEKVQCRLETRNCAPVARLTGEGVAGGARGSALTFSAATSSDADGDALTYAWTVGGQPAGTGASLSHTFSRSGSVVVSVRVTDGKGGSATDSVTVTVTPVVPASSILAPATSAEGAAFIISAGAVTTGASPSYEFTLDCGTGFGAWGSATDRSCTVADNGSVTVRAKVRDDEGTESPVYEQTVAITNVAPSASLAAGGPLTVTSGAIVSVTGSFADAGVNDAPWSWSLDMGVGPAATGSRTTIGTVPGTATYRKAGTYTIAFSVTDKDGATGAATPLTLTVNRIAIGGAVLPATIYVNDRAQGIITFVILGTPTFDPMTVDAATARIGDVGVIRRANGTLFTTREDVNNDGILDFVLRFDKDELVAKRTLASGVSTLSLHADLADGRQMVSTVAVTVRP